MKVNGVKFKLKGFHLINRLRRDVESGAKPRSRNIERLEYNPPSIPARDSDEHSERQNLVNPLPLAKALRVVRSLQLKQSLILRAGGVT